MSDQPSIIAALRARVLFFTSRSIGKPSVRLSRRKLFKLLETTDWPACLRAANSLPDPWRVVLSGDGITFGRKESADARMQAQVQIVFDHWRDVTKRTNRVKLSDARARKIRARLKEGYTVEQLTSIADAVMQSSFHVGVNDRQTTYTGIETIYRSADKVDQWLSQPKRGDLLDSVRQRTAKRRNQ